MTWREDNQPEPFIYAEKWINEAEPVECDNCGKRDDFSVYVVPASPDFPDQGPLYTLICQECGHRQYIFAMP